MAFANVVLVLATMSCVNAVLKSEHQLELVQIIFQNGETTPFKSDIYVTDPHDASSYEPWGYGQLTDIGKTREYKFGQTLRQIYKDFIDTQYNSKEVYTYSANEEYMKMSLNYLLEGLYSNLEKKEPEGIYPRVEHYHERVETVLNPRTCEDFIKAEEEVLKNPEVIEKFGKYEGLYEYLKLHVGEDCNSHERIIQITSVLNSQISMNLDLPDWCTPGVLKLLKDVTVFSHKVHSFTDEMKRYNGGPLIRAFWEHMSQKNKKKLYLYSGSQGNLAGFARALNLTYPKFPAFGSAVIMEKRRNENNEVLVRILAWSGSDSEVLFPLQIPGCEEYCPIEEFYKIIEPILPSDDELKCLLKDEGKKKKYKKH